MFFKFALFIFGRLFNLNINTMNIVDTTKAVIDTVKTVIDSTAVEAVKNVATETTIWQDKSLMTVFAVVGGIILILGGLWLWDVLADRKE